MTDDPLADPIEPVQARKRPVEVSAFQWDGTVEGAVALIGWVKVQGGDAWRIPHTPRTPKGCIVVVTLDARGKVFPGDYVVRGTQGEFYPCAGDVFDEVYEVIR